MQPPPLPDERQRRTQLVRERYRRFVLERMGEGRRSWVLVTIGLLLLFSLVLIPLAVLLLIKGLRRRNPMRPVVEAELAFIDRAEAALVFPLMVNRMLRQPGDRPAPGLFLAVLDADAPQTLSYVLDVAAAVGDPAGHAIPEADAAFVESLWADEEYQRSRRRPLPVSITKGYRVDVLDLAIHPWYLPNRHIADDMPGVPCLIEPGDQGQARVVPYWCAVDFAPPPYASATPVFVG